MASAERMSRWALRILRTCLAIWSACRTWRERNQLRFMQGSGLEHFDECFLRNVDAAKRFHALFAFFLFFQELAFAGDVAAVAFGGDILAQRADGLARD